MPFQILINLLIAFIWMFLQNSWTLPTFIMGYLLGILLLFFLQRFLPETFYMKRVMAIINLILLLIKELFLSSYFVIKEILKPTLRIRSGIFAFPTELKKDWEITTLANMISLTPGTLTIDISPEGDVLYIHAMDLPDVEETLAQIKNTFEKAIKEVSQ